jgi:CNT family concentrative nucleoside transporter
MTAGAWLQGIIGLTGLCGLAWLVSENRRIGPWRAVAAGLGLQFALALLLLQVPPVRAVVNLATAAVEVLAGANRAGGQFVFGFLGGAEPPFDTVDSGKTLILAFQTLTLVILISALTAVLIQWRVLPWIVRAFSALVRRPFGISGAAGLGMAANIFVGMVEAPLFIRDHLARLSRSDLFVVMGGGMATIAGTMFAVYSQIIADVVPDAAGHLLTASVISAPAAIMIARIMVPPAGPGPAEADETDIEVPSYGGTMDAITKGTRTGLDLYLNIVAMLLVLVALVHLANVLLGFATGFAEEPLTLERVFGWCLAPLAWLMGIPASEAATAGALLGTKTVLNEFLAYLQLVGLEPGALTPRSELIMTYALCGFANFGSLGIMIGGLGTLAPTRRDEIVELGLKSIAGGTLATCCTGAVVGLVGAPL